MYVNGVTYLGSRKPEAILERICAGCLCRESKKTGCWKSDLTIYEVQKALFENGQGHRVKLRGLNGEMEARVPPGAGDVKVLETHKYVSQIQAKQQMDTCRACGEFCLQVAEGGIQVKEPFAVV